MIWNALDRYRDLGLLLVRIGFGAGFIWFHGLPKVTGGPERWAGTGTAGLVFVGPGRFSLDHLLAGRRREAGADAVERPERPERPAAGTAAPLS